MVMMTVIRGLCLLFRLHRSISVILWASRLSPLIRPTIGESLRRVVGNTIYYVKVVGTPLW